jgi:hypothetical protein
LPVEPVEVLSSLSRLTPCAGLSSCREAVEFSVEFSVEAVEFMSSAVRTYHLARYSTPREGRRYELTVSTFKTSAPPARERARGPPAPRAGGARRGGRTRARGRHRPECAVPPETLLMIFRTRHLYELWICTIVYTVEGKLGGIAYKVHYSV